MRARKSFYTSALCAISVLFLSLIPIPASSAAAGNYEITIDTTNVGNTGEDAKPIPSGTAWTGTINLFNTAAGLVATDQLAIKAHVASGPDATDITAKCTFSAKSVANFSLSVLSANDGELGIDLTGAVAIITATTTPLFDFSCPTDMGGPYTITFTESTAITKSGFATGTFPIPTANTPDSGLVIVSGIVVTQAIKRGFTGETYPGNRIGVKIFLPSQNMALTYLLTLEGSTKVVDLRVVNGTSSNITSNSIFVRTNQNSNSSSLSFSAISLESGTRLLAVSIIDEQTGKSSVLYAIEITWTSLSRRNSYSSIDSRDSFQTSQGSNRSDSYILNSNEVVFGAPKGTLEKTSRIATIELVLVNDTGTPATQGHLVSAVAEGSILVEVDVNPNKSDGLYKYAEYRLRPEIENVVWIHINSDGTEGPGKVNIYVADARTGIPNLFATWAVYSWGELAKLEIVKSNFSIGLAGYTTGAATSTRLPNAEIGSSTAASSVAIQGNGAQTTTPAFIVKATDASGQLINLDIPPEVISSDTKVATGGACSQDDGTTIYSSGRGYGYYNCFFSIASTAKSGDKATLTIRSLNPTSESDTSSYIYTTYEVSVGGFETNGTVTMIFDKETYKPGEEMSIIITATDEAGNPVFDGHPAPEISLNLSILGTVKAGFFIGGKFSSNDIDGNKTLRAPSEFDAAVAIATSASGRKLEARSKIISLEVEKLQTVVESSKKSANASVDAAKALKRAQDAAARATTAATKARASADKTSDAVEKLTNQFDTNLNSLQAELARLINTITSIITKI